MQLICEHVEICCPPVPLSLLSPSKGTCEAGIFPVEQTRPERRADRHLLMVMGDGEGSFF